MPDKKKKINIFSHAKPALLILLTLLVVVYLLTVIGGSDSFFNDTAQRSALLLMNEELNKTSELVSEHYDNLYEIADKLKYSDNKEEVQEVLASYIGSDKFGDLRYYVQSKAYSANGIEVSEETSAHDMISALAASNTEGCTEVYFDSLTTKYCIALFIPVRGSAYVDGLLSILPARNLIDMSSVLTEGALNTALISPDGVIFASSVSEGFDISFGNEYHEFLTKLTNDKEDLVALDKSIALSEKTAMTVNAQTGDYVLSISPVPELQNKLYIITMREVQGLISTELTYVRNVVNLLAIFIIAVFVILIYIIIFRKRAKQAVNAAVLTDLALECPNTEGFHNEAREHMRYGNRYAIMAIAIHNFRFQSDLLGEELTSSLLKYITKTLESFKERGECYGYAGDGKFLYLKRFVNEKTLGEWIRLINSIINRNEDLKVNEIKIKLDVGAFKAFEGRRRTVADMTECALAASKGASNNLNDSFVFYSEEINRQRAKRDLIESQMESALENGEFRVFFQPKYNIERDCIDSAEALVRWFDPMKGDYMFPGDFIAQFESNGFISKLDHFVYIKVLEYLSEAAKRGEKVVPISVNVSRVTAGRDDFLSFYIGNKKKYRIDDGIISIELTESFAMEDYGQLVDIVDSLRKNGIKTSIDDFGAGYSSFNVIRQVMVDELKMDRAFIQKSVGGTPERDDKVLHTVISLAKSLGMKVVQEGIETKEDFDRVVELGCDIVQGYYYAKAVSMEEFRIFITTNTSIKYKSLVK